MNQFFNFHKLDERQIQFYKDHGYLKVGSTLTDSGIAEMKEQCMKVWHEEKREFNPDQTWLKNALLIDIHKKSPLVKEFYFNGPMVDIMEQLIGPNIKTEGKHKVFRLAPGQWLW